MDDRKPINPVVAIGVVVVLLGLAGFVIFRTISSSSYVPSPGVPGVSSGEVGPNGQKGPNGGAFYPTGPQGALPGQTSNPPTVTGGGGRPGR